MESEHPEWLPVDWKTCVRIRSSGKKDKYYMNPSNDLKFNSKPEVIRYLKDSEKELKQRKKNKSNAGAERENDVKVVKTSSENENESIKSAAESINPPETDASGQIENEIDSVAGDQQQEKAAVRNKRKKHSKWMNDLPRRTSKRLARVEADPPLEHKTSSGASESATLTDDKVQVSSKTEVDSSENIDKQIEASANLPPADLSSAEEHEGASVDIKEDENNDENLASSLNDLLMDPCIEFAIKTLTGAIPLEDINRTLETREASVASPVQVSTSSNAPPISDIWADPCFEFAVKTLTSEIPIEDGSHFQISFQQPLSSSGGSGCNSIAK